MRQCARIYRITDPEEACIKEEICIKKEIMDIITKDRLYHGNIFAFLLKDCVVEGKLMLGLAITEIVAYIELVGPRTKVQCFNKIYNAISECKDIRDRDCALFWIALYTIAYGFETSKLKLARPRAGRGLT